MESSASVREIRVAVAVDDFDGAVAFYRDALGLAVDKQWDGAEGRGAVFTVDRGSLEVVDRREADSIDLAEVGEVLGDTVRVAMKVDGVDDAHEAVTAAGASTVGAPVDTPWGGRSARVRAPDGLQLTLFREPAAG